MYRYNSIRCIILITRHQGFSKATAGKFLFAICGAFAITRGKVADVGPWRPGAICSVVRSILTGHVDMAGEYRWDQLPAILQRRRLSLIIKLGGCCVSCGASDPDELEFHHPRGKEWRSNQLSRSQRFARYEQDAAAGLVELLCDDCHNNPNDHPDTCFCPFCRGPDF